MSIKILKKQIAIIKKLIELYQLMLVQFKNKPVVVIIHHTATDRDTTSAEAIENGHQRFALSSLGKHTAYNVLITGNGETNWTRSLDERGLATTAFKGFHIDICLTGNFMQEEPLQTQLDALQKVLETIQARTGIKSLKGHRDFYATLCPGQNLYKLLDEIKGRLK